MSLPGFLGVPEKRNPTIHIVFAYTYRTETTLPMDYWIEGEVNEDDYWLDDFVNGEPEYLHNDIKFHTMPADANGVFEFIGKVCAGRSSYESTIDDEVWLEGDVHQIYRVVEHED